MKPADENICTFSVLSSQLVSSVQFPCKQTNKQTQNSFYESTSKCFLLQAATSFETERAHRVPGTMSEARPILRPLFFFRVGG